MIILRLDLRLLIRHVVRLLHIFKTVVIFLVSYFVYTFYVCTRTLFKIKHAFMVAFCVISPMWVFRLTLLLTCGFISHISDGRSEVVPLKHILCVFSIEFHVVSKSPVVHHQVPLACFS